jgi:rhamnosyltransferase
MIFDSISIIVLHNFSFDYFLLNIRYFKDFHKTIVVNNSSEPIYPDIDNSDVIILNNLNNNFLAGAYNLALNIINLNYSYIKYVVFIDEDSDLKIIPKIYTPNFYSKFLSFDKIASISPQYFDVNSKSFPNYLLLNKYTLNYLKSKDDFIRVTFTINSFSVWSYEAILDIGSFDINLKLDHIDSDYCLRAAELGYLIYINRSFKFNHCIGDRIPYRLFSYNFNSSNHNIYRRIHITKNSILILRKHFKFYPVLFYFILTRIFYDLVGIIFVEKNKFAKIHSMVKGIYKSFFYRI